MKKLLLLLSSMVVSVYSFAETHKSDSINVPLSVVKIIKVEGVSAEELYQRVELWAVKVFKNPDRVIRLRDKEKQSLFLTPLINYNSKISIGNASVSGTIEYDMKVNVKEGRCRVELANFYHKATHSFGFITVSGPAPEIREWGMKVSRKWCEKVMTDIRERANSEITLILTSLNAVLMTQTSISTTEDEW